MFLFCFFVLKIVKKKEKNFTKILQKCSEKMTGKYWKNAGKSGKKEQTEKREKTKKVF